MGSWWARSRTQLAKTGDETRKHVELVPAAPSSRETRYPYWVVPIVHDLSGTTAPLSYATARDDA